MSTSRQQVLEFVRTHRAVSAQEIAMALHMTRVNARHHLKILEGQGVVELIGSRQASGRGRPVMQYGLSSRVLGENLGLLTGAMLKEFFLKTPHAERGQMLERLVGIMLEEVSNSAIDEDGAVVSTASLTQRLYRSISILNELHYHARWEAHSQAPHIVLGHCPYASIIDEHPEVCQLDAVLINTLSGIQVKQTAKLALDSRGIRYCAFVIDSS
ncbi:MAG: HTH domain-containing protein [Chloroflexota bacterium]|nr:HTH domain-containing protein [Chloroflexota bacterium]